MMDTTARQGAGAVSCPSQSSESHTNDGFQPGQLFLEMTPPGGSQAIGLSSIGAGHRSNEPTLFEPRNGAVECAWPQRHVRKCLDIRHHCVSVFVAFGKACQNEKRWIGHVLRST